MFHLNHGVSSVFQTLGINHRKYNVLLNYIAPGLITILGLGFVSIPLSIFLGFAQ